MGLIGVAALEFAKTPTGFIPEQAQGYLINVIQLPPGSTLDHTEKVVQRNLDRETNLALIERFIDEASSAA